MGNRGTLVVDYSHSRRALRRLRGILRTGGHQRESRLARAALRRPAAARPDRHPRERDRTARGRTYFGIRARDVRHGLRSDPRGATRGGDRRS